MSLKPKILNIGRFFLGNKNMSTFLSIQDYVVVGSDSGRIVILEYNATKNSFDRVHMETFGEWTYDYE